MATPKKTDVNPILRELTRLKKPLAGRRLLSWILFLSLITIGLLLPVYSSMHPTDTEAFFNQHPKLQALIAKYYGTNTQKHMSSGVLHPTEFSNEKMAWQARHNKKLDGLTTDIARWEQERTSLPTFMSVDKIWNPGHTLDQSHQAWANDCKVCHSLPFKQVIDKDCKSCHQNILDHVDPKLGKVNGLSDVECATCHRDHNDVDGLGLQNKHYMGHNCVDCHSNIKKSFAKTKTENVKDFAKKHPDFRYQIAQTLDATVLERTRLSKSGLSEKSNLKFPHDVHLDKKGIKSPQDGKVVMECADCHTLKQDGMHFEPMTMKAHCQSCHDLKFEPAVSNREVPHGSVELVLNTLREFYSYVQVNTVPVDEKPLTPIINLVRPGKDEPKVVSYVSSNGDSKGRASLAAVSLFEKTSCNLCHEVTKLGNKGKVGTPGQDLPQYKIADIAKPHPWLVNSMFDHGKHRMAECTDCHAAEKSKKSSDVLMPSITACRDCHAGKEPDSNKLVSDCGLCHGFHQTPQIAHSQTSEAMATRGQKHP